LLRGVARYLAAAAEAAPTEVTYLPQIVCVSVLVVLNLADLVTTWIGLRQGMTEKNRLVLRFPRLMLGGKVLAVVAAGAFYRHWRGPLFFGLVAVDVCVAFTVAGNLWAIIRVANRRVEPW
jgi:hypothetical protein